MSLAADVGVGSTNTKEMSSCHTLRYPDLKSYSYGVQVGKRETSLLQFSGIESVSSGSKQNFHNSNAKFFIAL